MDALFYLREAAAGLLPPGPACGMLPSGQLFRELAKVDPLSAGDGGQLFRGQLHGVVGRTGGRIDHVIALEALVQEHAHPFRQSKGADPALGMAGEALHVLHGDEAGLFVEKILELAVVQTARPMATTSTGPVEVRMDSVLAIRPASQCRASAASATVALETVNSR